MLIVISTIVFVLIIDNNDNDKKVLFLCKRVRTNNNYDVLCSFRILIKSDFR